MTRPNDAAMAQIEAADPAHSTWVSANAGSGKTKVLTDRVARLLLGGVPPQRILCLTYTKAAAANMQNRLFARLGQWAMLPDAELGARLDALGEPVDNLSPDVLRMARTLFATALETPGGLKIQTIHAFCAAILRRFPLEAGVSPGFQEMDERSARKLRADILEDLADGADTAAFDAMARHFTGAEVDRLCLNILKNRDAFGENISDADIWGALGLTVGFSAMDALALAFDGSETDLFAKVLPVLQGQPKGKQDLAGLLMGIDPQNPTIADLDMLSRALLFRDNKRLDEPKFATVPAKNARDALGEILPEFQAFMERVSGARSSLRAAAVAKRTCALYRFGRAFIDEYDARKQSRGWLDFDDLILRTRGLLHDSSMAQWVLYKLDGGIDHILVDEAQDTSPAQWAVISRLTEEFFAGMGAREVDRTLFVVGDEKQSIYSFQGADPAEFGRMHDRFERYLEDLDKPLVDSALNYSFRSSQAILRLVDIVIGNSDKISLSLEVGHNAFHADLPGRVDLWPFIDKSVDEDLPDWSDPSFPGLPDDPVAVLAARIADAIAHIVHSGTKIKTKEGPRAVRFGDVLILVQRRSEIFHEIIRALKDRGLPVAGADRLRVGGELAVRDITSLLRFLVTPEDDLSLAETLRSPLFGLSEQDIFSLAHGRKGFLWQALRARHGEFGTARAMLEDLLGQTDYLRPYELIERVLIRHRGRENLIARLGREAEDGIDALLDLALAFEHEETPDLTGFLGWFDADETQIKRPVDAEPTDIRVMTVHAAKGLESAIVILPDTAQRRPPQSSEVMISENGIALWRPVATEMPRILRPALEQGTRKREEERMRLLYVAMTRAEHWLIVCGAGDRGKDGKCWYEQARVALEEAGSSPVRFMGEEVLRYEPIPWGDGVAEQGDTTRPETAADLPEWMQNPAPAVPRTPEILSPSDLGGAKALGVGEDVEADDSAMRRGRNLHLLLQHLPGSDPEKWRARAVRLLCSAPDAAPDAEFDALLGEVVPIISSPDHAFLFAKNTLAEVPVTAQVAGQAIMGIIDRLVISPQRILVVDFKSNADVPARAEATPEGILRQMGAYATAMEQVYPNHRVETAILWTKTGELMALPHEIVTQALGRVTAS